jgi:hypothetical protein
MKKGILVFVFTSSLSLGSLTDVSAQCSICTRTSQQLGEKPAKALNTGILYLGATPLLIAGLIGYRWWKSRV